MTRALVGLICGAFCWPAVMVILGGAGLAWIGGIFTVAVALVAVPIVLFLRWRIRVTFLACVLSGALLGLFGSYLVSITLNLPYMSSLGEAWGFIEIGVASAIVFWIVGVWRNPWFVNRRGVNDAPAT